MIFAVGDGGSRQKSDGARTGDTYRTVTHGRAECRYRTIAVRVDEEGVLRERHQEQVSPWWSSSPAVASRMRCGRDVLCRREVVEDNRRFAAARGGHGCSS